MSRSGFSRSERRHHLLQRVFWSPLGVRIVETVMRFERRFDTVVRGYSLITATNGERWLSTLMDDAPVVVDVGFHDGESTAQVFEIRPDARVVGFDPSRFGAESYEARFKDDPRVTFVNAALSHEAGEMDFYDYANMCNSLSVRRETPDLHASVYKVRILTFDAYRRETGLDRVNLMKIDAEGYDLNVLEGARTSLSDEAIDIFMFEFASGWANSKRYLWEAVEYLQPFPYRLFRLFNGFLVPLVYDIRNDSCCTLPAMYVGVSERRFARGDIPVRHYRF